MPYSGLIILIADRNPNIRSLIMRELKSDGYETRIAGTVSELIYHISGLAAHALLVIIDPDLPDAEPMCIERVLNERIPPIPVIIHALNSEFINYNRFLYTKDIVEKDDSSIDAIKKSVARILSGYSYFNMKDKAFQRNSKNRDEDIKS